MTFQCANYFVTVNCTSNIHASMVSHLGTPPVDGPNLPPPDPPATVVTTKPSII